MRLYEAIKHAASNNMSLCIKYDCDEDVTKVIVSKKDGVSLYQKEMHMYGKGAIDPTPGDLLLGNVETLVKELKEGRYYE